MVCVKFLEKTVAKEEDLSRELVTSRQCFYERILWCLARLKSTVKSANDHVLTGIGEPENFITLLDQALDALSPFVALDGVGHANVTNKAEQRAELMMESREIREMIEVLLSHAMAFSNISVESDKIPLTTLSQNLLKVAMEFEEEFSLSQPGKKLNPSNQRLKAIELENSLFRLEKFVNDALLRLVYEVFHAMNQKPIEELKSTENLDEKIKDFDLLIDRLLQIGHFAISFSKDDQKVSTVIRSCVASVESLDSYLIPAISSKNDPSIEVLQSHFEEETKSMMNHVQQIIDTKAFCSTLMDMLNQGIEGNRIDFDKKSLERLVQCSNVLLDHFQINSKSLKLSEDKVAKFYFHDFKLILNECDAILNFPEVIDDREARTLKRFKILWNTTKKLQNAIKNQGVTFEGDEKMLKAENPLKFADFPSKCSDYFNTIRPSALGSILYESKRSMKLPKNLTIASKSTLRRSKNKKRSSLRIAIFKKQVQETAAVKTDDKPNDSFDLQITEILEKLSDLSTTLSKEKF